MNKAYNIIEVANTHGGDINYVLALLEEFKEFKKEEGCWFPNNLLIDKVASPRVFESPIHGTGNRYSIQLSYGRMN